MNTVASPVAITSPARKSRLEFTPREEQIAAKWRKPSGIHSDIVMYETLLQLLYLASIFLGLLAAACVVAYVADLILWVAGRPSYFKIDFNAVVLFGSYLPMSFIILEGYFTTQIAKLKYIGQLQERLSGQAEAPHG